MVKEPTLYKKRVVLLGDAGYCPTFLSGMGASLSLLGAKCLSNLLIKSPDNTENVFKEYNTFMQPILHQFRENARSNANSILATSPFNLYATNLITRFLPKSILYKSWGEQFKLSEENYKKIGLK